MTKLKIDIENPFKDNAMLGSLGTANRIRRNQTTM